MRLAGLAVVALAAAACSSGATVKAKPVVQPKLGPPVDEAKAKKDAQGLVGEVYETIGRGDTKDGLFTLLSDRLIVLGPRKLDSFATRADALVAIQDLIDPRQKKKTPLKSGSLAVVASPGGRSAWVFDVIGTDGGDPLALTAILTNYDDLWTVETAFLARMPAHAALVAERARDGVVPPAAGMKAKMMESSNGPPLKAAVEKFQKGLLDQQLWGDDLADTDNALLVGPEAGEVARGKAVGKMWAKRMETRTRFAATGEIAAAATVDGQLAWVSAPVTRAADGEDPLPLRAFAIFERAGAGWKMIALQESLAIDAPGSGTAWKKIVPPRPPEPKVEAPPPAVAKVEPKKADEAPRKAKKADEPKVAKKVEASKKAKKADEPVKLAKKTDETPKKKKADPADEAPKKKVKKADDADETPRAKRKKKADDADDELPRKKKVKKADDDDELPRKKKKKADDDDKPKKKVKKAADDEAPKKKKADDADEAPKKKAKKVDDDDDRPKKKAKKVDDDDDRPKKKAKKVDDDDEAPKKKKKADDADEAPKKKAGKVDDDDDRPKKKARKVDDDDDKPKKKAKKVDDDDDVKISED